MSKNKQQNPKRIASGLTQRMINVLRLAVFQYPNHNYNRW
jgi:hypothetical protein